MTDTEIYETIGRTRAEYKAAKQELAALKARAANCAKLAETVARGLNEPQSIRWWDGGQVVGRTQEHAVFTSMMFSELSEEKMRRLTADLVRAWSNVSSLRQRLTELEGEDPERG